MFVISDVVNGPEQSRIISTLGNCNSAYSQLIRDYAIEKQSPFWIKKRVNYLSSIEEKEDIKDICCTYFIIQRGNCFFIYNHFYQPTPLTEESLS